MSAKTAPSPRTGEGVFLEGGKEADDFLTADGPLDPERPFDAPAARRSSRWSADLSEGALLKRNESLVHYCARRLSAPSSSGVDPAALGLTYEDHLQAGTMGLIRAIRLYDPKRGVRFGTYAYTLVRGHILWQMREMARGAGESRARGRALLIQKAEGELRAMGLPAAPSDVAGMLGADEDEVSGYLGAARSPHRSIDDLGDGRDGHTLEEVTPGATSDPARTVPNDDLIATVWRVIDDLPPMMRETMYARHKEELSWPEYAEQSGRGVAAVWASYRDARKRVRERLEEMGITAEVFNDD